MKLRLRRIALRDTYTIGKLEYLSWGGWKPICDTLEDKVRDYNKDGDLNDANEQKVYGKTAIPYGTYEITLDVVSPKFSKYPFYQKYCDGKLPRLLNVPHFSGILIHCAEGHKGAELVQGCIGVGSNTIVGGLTRCKEAFVKVNNLLQEAKSRGETSWIEII